MKIRPISAVPKAALQKLTRTYNYYSKPIVSIRCSCNCYKCVDARRALLQASGATYMEVTAEEYGEMIISKKYNTCSNWHIDVYNADAGLPTLTKDWTRCSIMVYFSLLQLNNNHNGVMEDVDLDDIADFTGFCLKTIRSSLKLLASQGLIYQHIHDDDRKFVDIYIFDYEESYKPKGTGYLTITAKEYSCLAALRHSLSLKVALCAIETTDANGGNSAMTTRSIRKRAMQYIRDYQIRNVITLGSDADILNQMLSIDSEKLTEKKKHKKAILRVKFKFGRNTNVGTYAKSLVDSIKDRVAKLFVRHFVGEDPGQTSSVDEFVKQYKEQVTQIANLAMSYSPDLILEVAGAILPNYRKDKNSIKNLTAYISKCCSNGLSLS